MSTAFDLAREQGYSDNEIKEYLSKKDPKIKQAFDEGYSFDEISNFLSKKQDQQLPESAAKGALRTALQVPLGMAEFTGLGALGQLLELGGKGEAISGLQELEENLPRLKELYPQLPWENVDLEKGKEALEAAEKFFPLSVGGLGRITEEATGVPTGEPKTEGQRYLRMIAGGAKAAPGKAIEKTIRGASIPAVSKLLQQTGLSEPLSDFLAFGMAMFKPSKKTKPPKRTVEIPEGRQPPEGGGFRIIPPDEPPGKPPNDRSPPGAPPLKTPGVSPTGAFVEEIETFPSGLTKPRAVGAKKAEAAIVTPAQQEKALEALNKEAAKISTEKFQQTFPTAKKVMEGVNLEGEFHKGFGELERQAAHANPSIEIEPFTKFLREEQAKYRGIPTLDKEARQIVKWIEDFRSQPVGELKNLMKVYRSNNRTLKRIYDKAKISGVPDHYVNFLTRANKEIANAIRKTLPEDSLWMKRFDQLNKDYKNYQDAKKVSEILRPLLGGEPTAANLRKIAKDPKTQRILELKMGEEAAGEIIQIAKDLDEATKAINKISAKTIKELDDIYPIPLLFVGMKLPGIGYVAKKLGEGVRRIYGTNLLKPATRKVYRDAIKAAGQGNVEAYKKATDALRKEQGLIGHEAPKLLEYKPKSTPETPRTEPKPKIKKEKQKVSSSAEIRKRLLEEKTNQILDRIENSKKKQKKLEKFIKENPSHKTGKSLLEQAKKVQKNSEKLLKELEQEGEKLIGSKEKISYEKSKEKRVAEKKIKEEKKSLPKKQEEIKKSLHAEKKKHTFETKSEFDETWSPQNIQKTIDKVDTEIKELTFNKEKGRFSAEEEQKLKSAIKQKEIFESALKLAKEGKLE